MQHDWLITRNTLEAAALASMGIGVRPVTMRLHNSTGHDITEWNMQPASADGRYRTGVLRSEFNNGDLKGSLATTPLHPYLTAMRTMHNRERLLDCIKGRVHHSVEESPGAWILKEGVIRLAVTEPFITTTDIDLAVGLITIGCALKSVTHDGSRATFVLSRFSLPSSRLPESPRLDGGLLMQALRAGALATTYASEPFTHAMHALHCLREMRKHQHSTRYIVIQHATPRYKGAALAEKAGSEAQAKVSRVLGVKL